MHIYQKVLALVVAVSMMLCLLPVTALAAEEEMLTLEELRGKYGAVTVEAYNIGQGFLVEPSLYVKDERSAGEITVDFLTSKHISYQGSTSYFGGFAFDDKIRAEYPDYLTPYLGELEAVGDGDGYLAEFDYSYYAGWVFTINDWWSSLGADTAYPGKEIKDYNTGEMVMLGDVIRWHYTVYGYGADCGFPGNVMAEYMGGNLFTQEDKTDLLFLLAAINDYYGNLSTDDVYEQALAVAADPLASAEDISAHEEALTSYIAETYFTDAPESIEIYHTLNLASDISINYVVAATDLDEFDSFYLSCKVPTYEGNTLGAYTDVEIQPQLRGSYYYFTLNGITAVQINDIIEASLIMEKNGRTYTSDTDEYSVAAYAYAQLNKSNSTEALKTLCAELLRYGAKTQLYKGYRTEALADADMTPGQLALLTELDTITFGNNNQDKNDLPTAPITWEGKSLDLNSKVTLKYIFSTSHYTGSVADLSLRVSYVNIEGDMVSNTVTAAKVYNASKNWYVFDLDTLLAAELRTVVSAAVYHGDTQVSSTLVYSADTYGNNKSGSLLTLCKALFSYSDSAKSFFG